MSLQETPKSIKKISIFFDGGCKPNPGKMEVAVILRYENGVVEKIHRFHKQGTNNEAEWVAFLLGLEIAKAKKYKNVEVLGDSSIVVNQANGTWKCKSENLIPYLQKFEILKEEFDSVKISFIRRDKNLAGQYIESIPR